MYDGANCVPKISERQSLFLGERVIMLLFDEIKSNTYNTLGIYPVLNSPFGLWPIGKNNFLVKTCWFVSTFELVSNAFHSPQLKSAILYHHVMK